MLAEMGLGDGGTEVRQCKMIGWLDLRNGGLNRS